MINDSNWLSRQKLTAFGSTLLVIGMSWLVFDTGPDHTGAAYTQVMELNLPQHPLTVPAISPSRQGEQAPPQAGDAWERLTVEPGQTLDAIFRQQGFSIALLHQILDLNKDTKGLTRIRPGEVFDFRRDADGGLAEMRYALDEEHFLTIRQEGGNLSSDTELRQMTRKIEETQGVIKSSLFAAGKEAGLSDAMVMKLANIFGWDIDFVLDIRAGDRFMLVYEKIYRDGDFLRDGNILAATFINQGERFQAIWYKNGDIADYFSPDGRSMRKAFLRAPLNFSYISSGFNPRRMHPVLKRIRPHNGIDYYAPPGTPVYAAGDGTVIRSAYSAANGNHVFIRHANNIVTKYLHFRKRAVQKGQKVKQGQVIGYVGSTGLATGPHLHYEFVVNGVHRNPRTVPLPKAKPLEGALLADFRQRAAPMLTQLSRLESASLYAQKH